MKISSPCMRVCKISKGKCTACGRKIEDVKNWHKYSEEKRLEIMSKLP